MSADEINKIREKATQNKQDYLQFTHKLASGEERDVEAYTSLINYQNTKVLFSIIHDITARRKIEKQLRHSEERYRKLAENFPDTTITFYNRNLEVSFVCGQELAKLNKKPEDFIGKRLDNILTNELLEGVKPLFLKAFNGEIHRIETPSFNNRYVYVIVVPIVEKDGSINEIQVISQNITERKKAELALEKMRYMLAQSQKIAHLGSFEYSYHTQETIWSEEEYNIYGLAPTEPSPAYEVMLQKCIHQDERALLNDVFINAIQNSSVYELEHRIVRPDGSIRWVYDRAYPYFDKQGKLERYIGTTLDITERKKAEEKLREREELLSMVGRVANIGGWDFDVITGEGQWTDEVAHIHDMDITAQTNKQIGLSFYTNKSKEQIEVAIQQVIEHGISYDLELELISAKGIHKWIRTIGLPVIENGRVVKVHGSIQDITDRKLIEEKLRESEKQYRYLFENNPHPMWAYDLHTLKFLAVNDLAINKYGYSREEFLTMTLADIRPESEWERLYNNLAEPRKTVQISADWKHKLKDGSIIDVEITSHLINLEGQNAALVIALDITEKKKAQKALIESEERFRQIAETIEDVFWMSDVTMNRIFYISPAFQTVWGRTPQSLYENPASILESIVPDDSQKFIDAMQHLTTGEAFTNEYKIRTPSGEIKHILDRGFPIFDENKNVIRFVGVAKDVTERINQENEIKKLSIAVEQSPVSIIITDLNSKIEYVNEAFLQKNGYSKGEIIGNKTNMFKSGLVKSEVYKELWETIKNGKNWQGEFINYKKNGEICYEKSSISPLFNKKGLITNYLEVKLDITKEKLAEQKILQLNEELEQKVIERTMQLEASNTKLEELNKTKDKFFSIIAHDLKNPFAAMLSSAELLLIYIENFNIEKIKAKSLSIIDSIKHGYSLLQNLLEWSQAQQGLINFHPQKTDIQNIIQNCFNILKLQADNKSIQLKNNVPANLVISVDNELITILLRNLISNAIKFTHSNGLVEINHQMNESEVQISVQDSGIGMSQETVNKLFRISEKNISVGTNGEKGTGLGLLLCKEFLEMHNGRIWVESEEGKGATFKFTLPKV